MLDLNGIEAQLPILAKELGFSSLGVTDVDLTKYEPDLKAWLEKKYHGSMQYMEQYGTMRARPVELVPGTLSIIMVRMDYLPPSDIKPVLKNPNLGAISRYALGRDYHKLMRKRLQKLADKISEIVGPFGYRAFTDSAPIMEKPLAEKAGLGWIGKNTLLLNKNNGSYFFLGCLFTDLPLKSNNIVDRVELKSYCGSCTTCIDICPTKAIVGPRQLDARRCISYLTIENKGSIPKEFRVAIGNRIYGCDDCQVFCPWNKFAKYTSELDFYPRNGLDAPDLIEIFLWSEETFRMKTEGSAIKRIGYQAWLRNVAIALGNAPRSKSVILALKQRLEYPSDMVQEHVRWALDRQNEIV